MSGQMIIVYVIGVAVGAYLVYRIYRAVAGKRRGGGCPNCCSGGEKLLLRGVRKAGWWSRQGALGPSSPKQIERG